MRPETRYQPATDQRSIAGELGASIAGLLPLKRLHDSAHESEDTWSGLEEMGMFGISVAEDQGGSGLGAVEEALIVMDIGRRLASPGVLATIACGPGGRVAAAWREGGRTMLVDEPGAARVLLRDAAGAALYEMQACASQPLDNRLWLASLQAATITGKPLARFDVTQVLRLRLLDAAVLAGNAEATLQMAVAYANLRQQFGRPIGTFQAVKHHCANMAIAARCAQDQLTFAAVALDEARADAALQVECALLVAGNAALDNAGLNIQIHGGIGFSDEADPHLFLKRAQLQIAIAGGLEAVATRIAGIESHG